MSSLSEWSKIIRESGEQHNRDRVKKLEKTTVEDLAYYAKSYLVGSIGQLKDAFSIKKNCRFSQEEILDAFKKAMNSIIEDNK